MVEVVHNERREEERRADVGAVLQVREVAA